MEDKKQEDGFNADEVLENLLRKHRNYFTNERYTEPTSRYEAWLMASYLSNMKIAKVLSDIFSEIKESNIFQKQQETPIIKGENEGEKPVTLKRRR